MPLESFDLRDFVGKPYISSIIISKLLYAVSSWWGFASAADRQRLQALLQRGICMAYVPQKHLTSQNLQNRLMTHYSNASCTTHTMSCTTSSLNCANLYITSDQDITIGNYIVSIGQLSPVSCANGILFIVCCSKTLINCFITVFTRLLLFVFLLVI